MEGCKVPWPAERALAAARTRAQPPTHRCMDVKLRACHACPSHLHPHPPTHTHPGPLASPDAPTPHPLVALTHSLTQWAEARLAMASGDLDHAVMILQEAVQVADGRFFWGGGVESVCVGGGGRSPLRCREGDTCWQGVRGRTAIVHRRGLRCKARCQLPWRPRCRRRAPAPARLVRPWPCSPRTCLRSPHSGAQAQWWHTPPLLPRCGAACALLAPAGARASREAYLKHEPTPQHSSHPLPLPPPPQLPPFLAAQPTPASLHPKP